MSVCTKTRCSSLAREAVLEAEVVAREWVRKFGPRSDVARVPAVSRSNSRDNLKSPTSASAQNDENRVPSASLEATFVELQRAVCRLSVLSQPKRHTPVSRLTSALSLKHELHLLTPLLVLYASTAVDFLAEWLVKGCARIVERDASNSVVTLESLVHLMSEETVLGELWKAMVSGSSYSSALCAHARRQPGRGML